MKKEEYSISLSFVERNFYLVKISKNVKVEASILLKRGTFMELHKHCRSKKEKEKD
jgi:hypothetical protein